jgi:hypothetical protein
VVIVIKVVTVYINIDILTLVFGISKRVECVGNRPSLVKPFCVLEGGLLLCGKRFVKLLLSVVETAASLVISETEFIWRQ